MNKTVKIGLYGVLVWLIPFLVAFLFYSPEGQILIDVFLFKSIMIVVSSLVGAFLLVSYFKRIKENNVNEGIVVGVSWFVISIILDLIILLPMSQMDIGTYFAQIGLRYLVIPIMAVSFGLVTAKK